MKTYRLTCLFSVLVVAAVTMLAQVANEGSADPPAKTARRSTSPAPTAGARTTPSQAPAIGHVETRDRLVTILAGPKGPVYTVRTKQGRVLHENLSGKDLQAKAPQLYEVVKSGYAGAPGKGAVRVDASVRLPIARAEGR